MHKRIAVYDNTISARVYISYIAEQAGGIAVIGRDRKLYIRKIGEKIHELPLKYFQNYKLGDMFKITRVRYEDGVRVFEKGDTTGNTIYINQDNMFIVDQEQIDNIYEQLKDLEVYSFEGDSIIDPSINFGDILIIDGKKVIYQGSIQYSGKFKASISSKIKSKQQEETTIRKPSQVTINRRVQSQIDQEKLIIDQLVETTTEHEEKITEVVQDVDSIKQNVSDIVDYKRKVEGYTEIHIEEAGKQDILELEIRGNKTYNNYLFPSEDLYPSERLFPNMEGSELI